MSPKKRKKKTERQPGIHSFSQFIVELYVVNQIWLAPGLVVSDIFSFQQIIQMLASNLYFPRKPINKRALCVKDIDKAASSHLK